MSTGEPESDFEREVIAEIERCGYRAVPQRLTNPDFPTRSFRIDIVVQHPERPGVDILAIECDGPFHDTPEAYVKDEIRQQRIEEAGWTVYRIHHTDWYLERGKAVKQLMARIETASNQVLATHPAPML